jgi:glycolate oxidase FAD binding subunit
MLKPASQKELIDIIAAGQPLEVIGRGTKRAMGGLVQAAETLDLSRFTGVEIYEPDELILAAGAATPLSEIEAVLATRGQQLAFEPPDYSHLLGAAHGGTIGGALACNLSGPRRIKAGAARDHILEVKGVTGRGDPIIGGARVVKNVTGYDLPKLMANSWGTLAALTTITFKVLPAAETEESVVIEGLDDATAMRAMSAAMQSSCEVSGAAHLPGAKQTILRIEGIAVSVSYRREKLLGLLKPFGSCETLGEAQSRKAWIAIRDVHPLSDNLSRAVWKISVAPMAGAAVFAAIKAKFDARGFYDWAGGLIWLDCPADGDCGAAVIRAAVGPGHAMLARAPDAARAAVGVFHPQPAPLAALAARVKDAFDPDHTLNPGRMVRRS